MGHSTVELSCWQSGRASFGHANRSSRATKNFVSTDAGDIQVTQWCGAGAGWQSPQHQIAEAMAKAVIEFCLK